MSLYKVAKSLNQIQEERSHRNRRLKAAPYIAGAAAGVATVGHEMAKKTGAPRMKMKGGKMVKGTQKVYHQFREKSLAGKIQHLKGSKAPLVAAAVGAGTALASKGYKYLAEEKARREEKSRRKELRGS